FVAAAEAPHSVPMVAGVASDFQLFGFASNLRFEMSIPSVTALVGLPEGLELVPPDAAASVPIGPLDPFGPAFPNQERQTSWVVHPNGAAAGVLPVNVSMNSSLGGATVVREVNVPQGTRYLLRTLFAMYTFPFTFVNSDPDVALGLPGLRASTG